MKYILSCITVPGCLNKYVQVYNIVTDMFSYDFINKKKPQRPHKKNKKSQAMVTLTHVK